MSATLQRHAMGSLTYSPLSGGWLSGRWRKQGAGAPTSAARPRTRFDMSTAANQRKLDIVSISNVPGLFNFTSASLAARAALGQDIGLDREFKKTTPKAGINWAINDDLFAYLSFTKGFRSGGWTGRALRADQYVNVNPEDVESWEVGLKATLADGRIRWNNTLFTMDYTDLFNSLQIAGVFTVQTADARIRGLESEFTWRVTPWLDLFANLGYLDPEYTGTRPANLATSLQRSPETQIKAGFSVDYPLGNGSLLVNGDWFHTDRYRISPANLAVTAPLSRSLKPPTPTGRLSRSGCRPPEPRGYCARSKNAAAWRRWRPPKPRRGLRSPSGTRPCPPDAPPGASRPGHPPQATAASFRPDQPALPVRADRSAADERKGPPQESGGPHRA